MDDKKRSHYFLVALAFALGVGAASSGAEAQDRPPRENARAVQVPRIGAGGLPAGNLLAAGRHAGLSERSCAL